MARSLEQPKAPRPQDHGPGYDDDFFRWTQHQAKLLRAGRFDLADVANLATEIEDMGKRDRRALGSRLEVLIMHLLKWQFQPEMRAGSWRGAIRTQRGKVLSILADSPGLRPEVSSIAALPASRGHRRRRDRPHPDDVARCLPLFRRAASRRRILPGGRPVLITAGAR
jgi:hypothetical protein